MDIKDFILIGGGLLIAAVIAHGFWIAWRARRDPLRLDLVSNLSGDDGDDLRRLRAELPNGGARVICHDRDDERDDNRTDDRVQDGDAGEPEQGALPLVTERRSVRHEPDPLDGESDTRAHAPARPERPAARRTEPGLNAPRRPTEPAQTASHRPGGDEAAPEPAPAPGGEPAPARGKVADVIMPERTLRADEPKEPRRWSARKSGDTQQDVPAIPAVASEQNSMTRQASRTLNRLAERATGRGGDAANRSERSSRGSQRPAGETRKPDAPVEELIVINVMSPKGAPFTGGGLVEGLRTRGLRYGDMNIFHRVDPMTRATLYSVASVVEPGTFDLADLENFRSPGVVFFMQLPGPEQPLEAFEDMLKVARDLALRLGGELKDEQRSVMTGQTVEHYRQRIAEFCRRRMSMRA